MVSAADTALNHHSLNHSNSSFQIFLDICQTPQGRVGPDMLPGGGRGYMENKVHFWTQNEDYN